MPNSYSTSSAASSIDFSTSSDAFSTISSIRPGWMRPSSTNRSKAIRAVSRRTGSKADKTTASGVSSIITSAPVACSKERIFLPSRPIILPFISSEGSCTTDTVVSAVRSAAILWIDNATILVASFSASRCVSSLISLKEFAASALASSSKSSMSSFFASSELRPARLSNLCWTPARSSLTSAASS